jgi:hypothetical protein
LLAILIASLATSIVAQGPRATSTTASTTPPTSTPAPAPQNVKAKYEGGIFGYDKKITGTLSFDDDGKRLLFRDDKQKEVFSIPYDAVASAFADNQSKRPAAASVIGSASIYTLPALLIKKTYRYLTLQYSDQDTHLSGLTSFKLDNEETLNSVLATLANKAGMTQRGQIYIKKRPGTGDGNSNPD